MSGITHGSIRVPTLLFRKLPGGGRNVILPLELSFNSPAYIIPRYPPIVQVIINPKIVKQTRIIIFFCRHKNHKVYITRFSSQMVIIYSTFVHLSLNNVQGGTFFDFISSSWSFWCQGRVFWSVLMFYECKVYKCV